MEMGHIIAIIAAIFGSAGFWTFLNTRIDKRGKNKSAGTKMLLGLGHDRVYELCQVYIHEGHLSQYEYENLMYLYKPYKELGGNGTAERLVEEVKKLPIINE